MRFPGAEASEIVGGRRQRPFGADGDQASTTKLAHAALLLQDAEQADDVGHRQDHLDVRWRTGGLLDVITQIVTAPSSFTRPDVSEPLPPTTGLILECEMPGNGEFDLCTTVRTAKDMESAANSICSLPHA